MTATIQSNARSSLRGAWLLAVFWNLVSAPLLVFVPRELERNPIAAIGFLFPAVGVALLGWAALATLRWRRFGPSRFQMSSPARPGGHLAGTIHTRLPVDAGSVPISLKLTCLERTITGSGKNRTVREHIVWRDEYTVSGGEVAPGPDSSSFAVHFALPADARATSASGRSAGVVWVLTAQADLPGGDFTEDFDIPVHDAAGTGAQIAAADAAGAVRPTFRSQYEARAEPVTPTDLATAGIHVRPTADGTEYFFAAARNPAFGIGTTAFFVIWSGALALQYILAFPWIFLVVTGIFELLLLVIVTDVWLGSTTVSIGEGVVRRRHSVLGIGGTRVIPCPDVRSLDLHISMQSTGRFGTPYDELRARLDTGRRTHLGRGIRDKRHAEWLAAEMRKAIGLR